MSLTAPEMKRLEDDARAIASGNCRGYLSDALRCLQETHDPIAPLELLRAMWSGGHAPRPDQKIALDDAGQWLEERLGREPGISPDRLELELGWLRRLVSVHGDSDDSGYRQRNNAPTSREPAFGAHIDQLRQRRKRALERIAAAVPPVHRSEADRKADSPSSARVEHPERLPDSFEVRFADWQDALNAFRTARERRKKQRPPKDRFLPVRPVAAELQPLAADIRCSMLDTEGMDELERRIVANAGNPPSFWIALADLFDRNGKRLPRRISFEAGRPDGDTAAPDEPAGNIRDLPTSDDSARSH
jgi:hypothetical protein